MYVELFFSSTMSCPQHLKFEETKLPSGIDNQVPSS